MSVHTGIGRLSYVFEGFPTAEVIGEKDQACLLNDLLRLVVDLTFSTHDLYTVYTRV